jgi:hypothetical protein
MKFIKILAVFLAAGPALAQTPDLDAVLDKVGDYVTSYERTFVGVVAEETSRQEVRGGRGRTDARGTTGDRAMPSRGRFMIDLPSGRVLSSQLIVDDNSLRAQIDVTYALEPAVEIFVPREMREQYALDDGTKIEGRATYAKFRRYVVTVDQTLARPKK